MGMLLFAGASASAQTAEAITHTVTGRVTETLHGRPVARALVNLAGRAVLTDSLGRFTFPGYTDQQAYIMVTKPGYTDPNQINGAMMAYKNLDTPLELHLDPDGIISGTITGRDGLPLGRVGVTLSTATTLAAGLSPSPVAYGLTDTHGGFRFQRPAGRYRVSVRYEAQMPETGVALLPVEVPDVSAGSDAGYLDLRMGEERRVEIAADTGPTFPVLLQVSGAAELGRRGMRVTVQPRAGEAFDTQALGTGADGQYLLKLPAGTYDLHLLQGDSGEPREAVARVTVSARSRPELALTLVAEAQLPVEAGFDSVLAPAAGTSTQPALTEQAIVQRLNLLLHNTSGGVSGRGGADIRLSGAADGRLRFVVPSGNYRLVQQGGGNGWYVTSATFGSSNLLTDDLALASGAAGAPIRVTLSNAVGNISGTVTPPGENGAWIYLIPRQPFMAMPPIARCNSTGSWNLTAPPGSYVAVAVSEQLHEDFRSAAVLARLGAAGQVVKITAAGQTSASLQMVLTPGGRL